LKEVAARKRRIGQRFTTRKQLPIGALRAGRDHGMMTGSHRHIEDADSRHPAR